MPVRECNRRTAKWYRSPNESGTAATSATGIRSFLPYASVPRLGGRATTRLTPSSPEKHVGPIISGADRRSRRLSHRHGMAVRDSLGVIRFGCHGRLVRPCGLSGGRMPRTHWQTRCQWHPPRLSTSHGVAIQRPRSGGLRQFAHARCCSAVLDPGTQLGCAVGRHDPAALRRTKSWASSCDGVPSPEQQHRSCPFPNTALRRRPGSATLAACEDPSARRVPASGGPTRRPSIGIRLLRRTSAAGQFK